MITKIKYPGSEEVTVELPYYFKTEDDDENEIFCRIDSAVITTLRFVPKQLCYVCMSQLWHPDHFPKFDFGNPFTDCQQIEKKEFEQAQMKAAKMLRIL